MVSSRLLLIPSLTCALACVQPEEAPVAQPRSLPKPPADLVDICVGTDTHHWFSSPRGNGNTSDAATFERQIAETERTVLTLDPSSSREEVRRFVDTYLAKPGFWKEIALSPGDPDRRWEGYEAVLSADKTEFAESEPILLRLRIDSPGPWDAPWWLFTPARIRVQDAEGRDVNLFRRPVCGEDGAVRSKVFSFRKEASFDLTSFVEPYYGLEAVNRFAPGAYTATFHFTRSDVWPDNAFSASDFAQPQAWGPKKSNAVAFTVVPASEGSVPDIDELFRQAEALVAESRANDAAAAYRRIVLESGDRETIERAILRILHVRRAAGARHDEEDYGPREETPPLPERIDKGLREIVTDYAERLRDRALFLSLLHVSEDEARAWYRAIVRVRDFRHFREAANPLEERLSRVEHVDFLDVLRYPMYASLLMEDLRSSEPCLASCARAYIESPGPKDVALLSRLLDEHPSLVLDHFSWETAPRGLAPRIARFFDDTKRRNRAYLAFEKAVGLDLGCGRVDTHRIARSEEIGRLLRDWWDRNRRTFKPAEESSP